MRDTLYRMGIKSIRDISGQRFGRLTVLDGTKSVVTAICDCGKITRPAKGNVTTGRTKSCGLRCNLRSRTRSKYEYGSWYMMIYRCTNPKAPDYPNWGGRGITVCEQWMDFEKFIEDMGPRPEGASLDRIDNEGNYEPRNCRWATSDDQNMNRRDSRLLSHRGITMSIKNWSKITGLSISTISNRLDRDWSVWKALDTPPQHGNSRTKNEEVFVPHEDRFYAV